MKNRRWSAVVFWLLCNAGAATQQSPAGLADSRAHFPPSAGQVQGRRIPQLSTLRAGAFETPPVPGGIGAGTLYAPGFLRVTSRAELYTQMIVHPNGIAVPNWILTSATNRTELTAEVVGIYIGSGASLGIYDWSCLPGYPCPNGSTEPSWQWTMDLSGL